VSSKVLKCRQTASKMIKIDYIYMYMYIIYDYIYVCIYINTHVLCISYVGMDILMPSPGVICKELDPYLLLLISEFRSPVGGMQGLFGMLCVVGFRQTTLPIC
jgi:hypothetical protein